MLAKRAADEGEPCPDNITNAPVLEAGLELYLQAFFDLDSDRTHSDGFMPIPWTSIASYAQAFNLDEEQADDLFVLVRKMDAAHLKRLAEKEKARGKAL